MDFHGATYSPTLDHDRLKTQLERVQELMLDGGWRTLSDIANAVCGSEAGVSARLRDLRNKFGFNVERKRVVNPRRGIFVYRIASRPQFDRTGQALLGLHLET